MKRIIFTLFVLSLLPNQSFSQPGSSDKAARLQTLLELASPRQSVPVRVLVKESSIQINEHVFPLAETTLVRCERQDGKYAVKFFLQAGTAITRIDDPTFRRAYWAFPLGSKQACQEFITIFDRLRTDVKKS